RGQVRRPGCGEVGAVRSDTVAKWRCWSHRNRKCLPTHNLQRTRNFATAAALRGEVAGDRTRPVSTANGGRTLTKPDVDGTNCCTCTTVGAVLRPPVALRQEEAKADPGRQQQGEQQNASGRRSGWRSAATSPSRRDDSRCGCSPRSSSWSEDYPSVGR